MRDPTFLPSAVDQSQRQGTGLAGPLVYSGMGGPVFFV